MTDSVLLILLIFLAPAKGGGANDVTTGAEGCGGGDSLLAQRDSGKVVPRRRTLENIPITINITRVTWRRRGNVGCRAAVFGFFDRNFIFFGGL